MRDDRLFAGTRVRDVATDIVTTAAEWQRIFVERDGLGPFDAWARLAGAIVDRTMRIERPDGGEPRAEPGPGDRDA